MPFEGDNMMGVKRNNRSATLRILHEKGDMSRKRLAEYMKLTPPAITKIVAELLEEGLLREGSAVTSGSVGRREILVELNTRAACAAQYTFDSLLAAKHCIKCVEVPAV